MRDYSFGNFLHELRVRRGLSQFQLGMLVGVSDKAVSKWENGLEKPQSRILYKLSEILGITVDEQTGRAGKAHGTLPVKHAMTLMWYKIYYSETFEKIVLKEK